jgi:magnesium transporter
LDFLDLLKVHLIDWRQAQTIHGTLKLETLTQNISKLHPADLANIIEDLNMNHMNKVVNSLDVQKAAYVFEKVTPELQKILIKHWGPKESSKILSRVSVKEVVDLMKTLPEEEAKIFISFLKDNRGEYVNKLIHYPNDTAGGLLTVDYATTKLKSTVLQTLEVIKTTSKTLRPYVYVFVIDHNNKFNGAVSIRKLLASKSKEKISKILLDSPKTKTLHPDDDIGKIIQIMTEYELLSAPVVDKKHKLIGVVSMSDVMGHLFPPK